METRPSKQALWAAHVQAWRASGLSQSAYCAQHGLKVASLSYWVRRLRQPAGGLTLVPLTLSPSLRGPALYSPSGWRLDLPESVHPEWLADLLRRLA